MSLPDIDISMIRSGMEVKKVVIHQRANALIDAYIRKTQEFWEYMKSWKLRLILFVINIKIQYTKSRNTVDRI